MQNEWRGHGEIMWKRKNDLKAECVLREAGLAAEPGAVRACPENAARGSCRNSLTVNNHTLNRQQQTKRRQRGK